MNSQEVKDLILNDTKALIQLCCHHQFTTEVMISKVEKLLTIHLDTLIEQVYDDGFEQGQNNVFENFNRGL